MKINREISSRFRKISSIALVGGMLLGNGITLYANLTPDYDYIQKIYHGIEYDYNQKVNNPEEGLFDEKLVKFCNDGIIKYNDIDYSINDPYIVFGQTTDRDIVYLQDYNKPTYDLLTNGEIDSSFKRKKIMLLKYSDVFANYFQEHRDNIENTINLDDEFINDMNAFVGDNNTCIPETYYYDEINHNKNR